MGPSGSGQGAQLTPGGRSPRPAPHSAAPQPHPAPHPCRSSGSVASLQGGQVDARTGLLRARTRGAHQARCRLWGLQGQGGGPAPRWETEPPAPGPLGRQGKPQPPGRDRFTFLLRPSERDSAHQPKTAVTLARSARGPELEPNGRGPRLVQEALGTPLGGQQRLPTSLWLRPPASLL